MNYENLRKLAKYLKGPLKAVLNMGEYSNNHHMFQEDCGTVGCAAGHGPYAGVAKDPEEGWSEYVTRVFSLSLGSKERAWCFASMWCFVDNTATGAAARIEWLLNHGLPENWYHQMEGKEPLCYQSK